MQDKVHSNSISKTLKCFWPVESKVYPCRFYPYLGVNVNTLALFPVSSPPPTPPQCTAPFIPCSNVRQETVSALLQNLQRYLPSQHAAELETAQQIHACTGCAHAHGRYPGPRIIDANGAAADQESGESQQRPNFTQMKKNPSNYSAGRSTTCAPNQNMNNSFLLCFFFFILCREQQNPNMWKHICLQKKYLEKGVFQRNANL